MLGVRSRNYFAIAALFASLAILPKCSPDPATFKSASPLVQTISKDALVAKPATFESLKAKILIMRDVHPAEKYLGFITANLHSFKQMGYTEIFLELIPPSLQKDVDSYLRTGNLSSRLRKKMFAASYNHSFWKPKRPSMYDNHYTRLFQAAREYGVKLVAMHNPQQSGAGMERYVKATDKAYSEFVARRIGSGSAIVVAGSQHVVLADSLRSAFGDVKSFAVYDQDTENRFSNEFTPYYPGFYEKCEKPVGEFCALTLSGISPRTSSGIYRIIREEGSLLPDYLVLLGN